MFPNSDAPLYHEAFVGTCVIVSVAIVSALTIPCWLTLEARNRKRKYGHAMPLRAIEDAGTYRDLHSSKPLVWLRLHRN